MTAKIKVHSLTLLSRRRFPEYRAEGVALGHGQRVLRLQAQLQPHPLARRVRAAAVVSEARPGSPA